MTQERVKNLRRECSNLNYALIFFYGLLQNSLGRGLYFVQCALKISHWWSCYWKLEERSLGFERMCGDFTVFPTILSNFISAGCLELRYHLHNSEE